MNAPSPTDVAYLAGLLDGEGSIYVLKSKRASGITQHWLEISVVNTHRPVIEWIRDTFGGRIADNGGRSSAFNRRVWRWRANSNEACAILELLLPYLHIKYEQAALAIEFQKHIVAYKACGSRPITNDEHLWRDAQKQALSMLNPRISPPSFDIPA